MSKIIDLSRPIYSNMPTYPGDRPVPKIESIHRNEITISSIRLGSHAGTHMDAPRHFFPDGVSLGKIAPESFVGTAVCLDKFDTTGELNITQEELDILKHLHPDWLLIYTGHDKLWEREEYFSKHPFPSVKMIKILLTLNITGIGIDVPSIDAADAAQYNYPVHHLWLGAGRLAVESLYGMHRLPMKTAIEIFALPLNIDADGAPARVLVRL